MEVSKCWKMVEFQIIWIKIRNCKTLYETQTANRLKEIIQFSLCLLWDFSFWGVFFRAFKSVFFSIFWRRPTMVAEIFSQSPPPPLSRPQPPWKSSVRSYIKSLRNICYNRNTLLRHSTWWEHDKLINQSEYVIGSGRKQPPVFYK